MREISFRLLALTRVDNNEPAVSRQREAPSGGFIGDVWCVEPGDGTHYEVAFRGDVVLASVGPIDEYQSARGIVYFDSGGGNNWFPYGSNWPSEYSMNVLKYFAELALGHPVKEPEELAGRRAHGRLQTELLRGPRPATRTVFVLLLDDNTFDWGFARSDMEEKQEQLLSGTFHGSTVQAIYVVPTDLIGGDEITEWLQGYLDRKAVDTIKE